MKKLIQSVMLLMVLIGGLGAVETKSKVAMPGELVIYDEGFCKFYIPSGWMGDYGDLKMNTRYDKNPGNGKTSMRFEYNAQRAQGAGWTGIYWQSGPNNWGDKRGGRNLSDYKKCTFMIRGDKGGEVIDKLGVGGITGQTEEGDTDQNSIGPVTLTNKWQTMEIDLKGKDMNYIIGGFLWAANADSNPEGMAFQIDDLKFVR